MEKKVMISQKHARHGIEHTERLLPYVDLKENQDYLELGCGNGHVCKHLARKYHLKVTGTDVDSEMIKLARENIDDIPQIRFMEMDATKMPFEGDEFDIVLAFGVMHHIRNWQDVLNEMSRVLKPGGYFIFGDIAYSRLTTRMMRGFAKNYGFYTIDDIIQHLKNNNFKIIYKEPRKGILLKYYSIVFHKIKGSNSQI
jgi:ubiquinone/menaquinone biosynthesis C-methylase UbiE